LTGLGSSKWGLGEKEEAYGLYLKALESDSEDLSALLHLVNASYAMARYAELEFRLKKYIEQNPANVHMLFCLAGCQFKQDKRDDCAIALEKLLEIQPDYADALELKQMLLRGDKAPGVLQESSTRLYPEENEKVISFASAQSAHLNQLNLGEVESQLAELENLKHAQDYEMVRDRADTVMEHAQASTDQRAQAQVLKGESLACLNEVAAAEQMFEQAKVSSAWKHRALAGLGAIKAAQGNWSGAKACFEESLALRARYDVAIAGLGICAEQLGDLEAAWAHYLDALKQNPENMRALLGIVKLGYPLKRLDDILKVTQGYLEIHPANLSILYASAGCLYALERYEESKVLLEKIKIFDPSHELACELQQQIDQKLAPRA
jgi:tetratricopeptide (TPR) repeat protein